MKLKNTKLTKKEPISILLLLWHPENSVAGGFVRLQEFLPYFQDFNITILDNSPVLITNNFSNVSIVSYEIPSFVKKFYKLNFFIGRLAEWIIACILLIYLGRKALSERPFDIIYGPVGDNPQIFFAGITLKLLFPSKKLVLDVLNLVIPEGSFLKYYKSFKKNSISTFNALINSVGMLILLFLQKIFIKKCDHIVTVSPYMRKIIGKYVPISKVSFTPSGVSMPRNIKFSRSKKFTSEALYVGRHTKEKGIFDLIDAWSYVVKRFPDAKLITAGHIPQTVFEALKKRINKLQLNNNIEVKGLITEEEKWQLLYNSKVFLHLAYYEPLVPVITILEALRMGVPVVNYRVDSIKDYPFLLDHSSLRIVENHNPKKAASQIIELLKLSNKEKEEIRIDSAEIVKRYNWKEIAKIESDIMKKMVRLTKKY